MSALPDELPTTAAAAVADGDGELAGEVSRVRGANRRRRGARRERGGEPIAPSAWRRLAACTAAAALLQLDGTLITVALPDLARGMHVSVAATSIVLSAYFLAYALLLLPGGALVDRLGARRVCLLGLALFCAGALIGAIAPSMALLVAARLLQGAGAGLVSPAALAGAVSGFPPARRGMALGIWGAAAGISNLAGPLLGGLLTMSWGWRANWWALVPLALLAATAVLAQLPRLTPEAPARPAQAALNRVALSASLVAALTFAVMIGSFYLAQQYLQRTVHYSALQASLALILIAFLVAAAAPLSGRLADRSGERLPALLGFLAAGGGLGVLAIPSISLHGPLALLLLAPVGLGLGMLFVPTSRAALNSAPGAAHGRISAVLSMGRLLGAGLGAGLAGAALSGGVSAAAVHEVLLGACALCLLVGAPAALSFSAKSPARPAEQGAERAG